MRHGDDAPAAIGRGVNAARVVPMPEDEFRTCLDRAIEATADG